MAQVRYLQASAKLKRGEDGMGKSPSAGKSEAEGKGVNNDVDLIGKEKDVQSKEVLDYCKQIRACLRETNPDEFDEAALQQFDKSEGQISATGLAELHTWLAT